ncbi:nickel pincer cofactor biosynthesis protein LarB [Priestia aryabhattai]|uniref:nickel pincer cofactor biosynthesis protein LarB n=1 Tax=Priestia aryabhattai TaxID=412384 RepID=UPI00064E1E49|nr:nickel pincer cofactor biosynthesis protein LarB [Priestia aryabhattai]KML30999.1 1-(5-phosphoribosyl)-5-amino-4-imidazole-carboxylate carboxylase [Priestia aryabhattai]KMN99469.1 1-(5-phosphoribosyl)-5-amino-4-imidazole-carboxylate carboxylase [Priestia aryabhattai]MED3988129.1 nickel pincer cofactor biosynthesis protein LarB [Priestia aryabhattai]
MIKEILKQVQQGKLTVADAEKELATYEDLGFAKVDYHRKKRQGFSEVVFGEGKTAEQIISIIKALQLKDKSVLVTRISKEKANQVLEACPSFAYNEVAKILFWKDSDQDSFFEGYIAIVCAGTSDLPVAEEAAVTAEILGCKVRRIYDVGVAGIHRLLNNIEEIQNATVTVVVAGMEGALPSVVGGLVSHPVIAVPTSIGYGANFNGLSALLTMLNSCSSGISVVNIDNGFGAAYNAALIHRLIQKGAKHDENALS